MKKTLQKIVTLLLVLSMLFGITATIIAATTEPGGGSESSSTGGVKTGWCDITYDDKGIVVELNPDVQSILQISKAELESVLNTLKDAAKELVVDDIKEAINNKFKEDNNLDDGGVNGTGATKDNIWQMAISGYIGSSNPSDYIAFLKNVLVDDAEIDGFVSHATNLMIFAVQSGLVNLEDLPSSENLQSTISSMFKAKIDEYVDAELAKLPGYIESYVTLLQGGNAQLDASIVAIMDDYVAVYVEDRVKAYIKAGFTKASESSADSIIASYMDSVIYSTVDSWIAEYLAKSSDELTGHLKTVSEKLNGWISDIANNYPNVTKNPLWDALRTTIETEVNAILEGYINDYFSGSLTEQSLIDEIVSFIDEKYKALLGSEAASDKEIVDTLFNTLYNNFWIEKEASMNPEGSALEGLWAAIDAKVKAVVISNIMESLAVDKAQAELIYASLTASDIKQYADSNLALAKTSILDPNLASSFTHVEWKIIWDGLDADAKSNIKESIKDSDIFKAKAKAAIEANWDETKIKTQLASWRTANNDNYKAIVNVIIGEAKTSYASLIKEEIYKKIYVDAKAEKLVLDVAKTIETLKTVFQSENIDKAALAEAVKNEANKKVYETDENGDFILDENNNKIVADKFKQQIFNSLVGYNNSEEIVAAANNKLIPKFAEKYTETYEALKNNVAPEVGIEALLTYIKFVKINDNAVYENSSIKLEAIKALIAELPRLEEIANMKNEDMQLAYSIEIATTLDVSVSFDITLRLGGGYDKVRTLAKLVARYIDFAIAEDGTVVLNVRVPAKFSELLLKVCETGRLPDELKEKVYALISGTPDDAVALLNTLTLDELVKIIDYIPVDEIVNSKYLENFERLEGLTAEQIKNRILMYREQFEKLINIINQAYNDYVPESLKDKTLADLYESEGVFSYAGTHSVSKETIKKVFDKVLSKVGYERYSDLIVEFFDKDSITASVDLTVEFTNVKKVEYVVNNEVHRVGFLPVGADVAFFAGITEVAGKPIVAWADAEGTEYTKMPNKDVTLYPVFTRYGEVIVKPEEGVDAVYSGQVWILTTNFEIPAGANVSYQWYKDGVLIEGATEATYSVTNVLDSGDYTCVVTIVTATATETKTSNVVKVRIAKKALNLNDYTWKPESFVYDGTEKAVYLVDAAGNKLELPGVIYKNNKAIAAGTYTATIEINQDNYEVTGMTSPFEWVINKAVYDMSGISFNDKVVVWNGEAHSIFITGTLPEGVIATYEGNGQIASGTYTITVKFTGDPNYEAIPDMTATLRILALEKHHNHEDKVFIESENGIPENYVLQVKDVTTQYDYVTSEIVFGDGNVGYILAAYDIYFTVDASTQTVNDKFTVRLLIPANLRDSEKELKVIHIAENGDVDDMNAVRDGDYFEFETTHFSIYAIVEVGKAPVEPKDVDLTWLWILLAVIAVAAIAAVVIIIIMKKRKGGDTDGTDNNGPAPEPVTEPTDSEAVEETTVEETAEEAPVEEAAVEETVEEAPVEEAAVEETVEEAPVEEAAVEETVEEAPVEEAAVEETVEEAPAEEVTVEETVEEAPAEEAAVEETVEEAPAEEAAVEETVEEAPVEEATAPETVEEAPVKKVLNLEDAVGVRYRTSFMSRLIQAEEPLQDYYTETKNALLSYKGVKARTSWNFESFNKGRVQCAKLNIKGSALQVYLALDTNEYNANKYHFTDVADKPKLDQVPMLLKVKSDRSLKYTIELIDEMMAKLDIQKGNAKYVDYHMPYETTEALAERDLVKVILPKGVTLEDYQNVVKVDVSEFIDSTTPIDEENAVEAPAVVEATLEVVDEPVAAEEVVIEEPVALEATVEIPVVAELHLDAEHADEIISDEEAVLKIEIVEKDDNEKSTGTKLVEINLDTICENFEENDTVNLKALKNKRLVNKSAGRLKVLARGVMTKKLTIYADKFSLQAVKMITLAGGHAEQYK